MSVIGDKRTTAKTRRARRCDWCDQMIEVGQPKVSWLWKDGSEVSECRMHPECDDAACECLEPVDNYEFTPGVHTRGCTCERGSNDCDRCEAKAKGEVGNG